MKLLASPLPPPIREHDPVKSAMEQFEWILLFVKWKNNLTDEELAYQINLSSRTIVRARADMNLILSGLVTTLPTTPLVMYLAMKCRPPLANQAAMYEFLLWYERLEALYQKAWIAQPKQYGSTTQQRAAIKERSTTDELQMSRIQRQRMMALNG